MSVEHAANRLVADADLLARVRSRVVGTDDERDRLFVVEGQSVKVDIRHQRP